MLNMAKITWGFDISAKDREIDWDVKTAYTDGFVFSPKRFPVNITPRSERHREVFEAEFQAQRGVFASYEHWYQVVGLSRVFEDNKMLIFKLALSGTWSITYSLDNNSLTSYVVLLLCLFCGNYPFQTAFELGIYRLVFYELGFIKPESPLLRHMWWDLSILDELGEN